MSHLLLKVQNLILKLLNRSKAHCTEKHENLFCAKQRLTCKWLKCLMVHSVRKLLAFELNYRNWIKKNGSFPFLVGVELNRIKGYNRRLYLNWRVYNGRITNSSRYPNSRDYLSNP